MELAEHFDVPTSAGLMEKLSLKLRPSADSMRG